MELLMIYKISPSPLCQRGGKKGKTFLKKEREKAEMAHSITRSPLFCGLNLKKEEYFCSFLKKWKQITTFSQILSLFSPPLIESKNNP